ncbi:hypothetical protein O181_057549 [Austropuccinia psidii MF-1]|uniref:Uncharacterized protein n=1 Tax=Austropuccinia psidii MF-1 TaxID=1389203 RepID=A0A9Q3EAS0_9BASI|nr:hypothetical protein [Austropuccinia psidii MF-1]
MELNLSNLEASFSLVNLFSIMLRENFFEDRKKLLYSTSFHIGRAAKWIEPYISNLTNQDPGYPLNNWELFESQLFTLSGDLNEVRKAEAEMDALIMKESGHSLSYISDFRSLASIIVYWGQRTLIHHFRWGFSSKILDQLAFHPSGMDSLQDLMNITLDLDTGCHERQKEKNHYQEQKPEVSHHYYHLEIQDVKEYNSVSSLHLLLGNVYLPPSSYHDSLEECCDEEEEPKVETVMNVVPCSYHHYLDVFFKVKSEKLPPHCTCDHHIKLDGSLSSVGVIVTVALGQKTRVAWNSGIKNSLGRLQKNKRDKEE